MSSSAELTHASDARSSTSLEQLQEKATEAAESPLLWEIGIRAPSPNQATKVCAILGLTNEDEKLVKAVAVLNRDNPQLLEEISGETTLQGENTMIIERGESYYSREELKKVMTFLPLLMENCGILRRLSVKDSSEGFIYLIYNSNFQEIYDSYSIGSRIKILNNEQTRIALDISPDLGKFFEARKGLSTGGWHDIRISVKDRKCMSLAKQIGEAFESAMRRRRSPAQAIILRDYYR